MCWALLCSIQVSFQVQVGPKMGVFLVKNSQNERMPYWPKKSTWKLDNGPKHTPSNWERCVGHLYAPSRWLSMSRWVQKWVLFGWIDRMPYWAKQSTWKLDNGPQKTPQAMGIVMLCKCCTRFSGRLSVYFEVYVVCGNVTQWTAIPILMVVDPILHLRKEARALIIGFSCLGGG